MDSTTVKYYYKDSKGQSQGPFYIDELQKLNLPLDTLIWRKGLDDWVSLSDVFPRTTPKKSGNKIVVFAICLIVVVAGLIGAIVAYCIPTYERTENCDVAVLNLNGNVTKLEVISQTTIPISDWLYNDVKSDGSYERKLRADAIYSFIGNSAIYFDNKGNIKSQTVYDNEGAVLYDKLPYKIRKLSLYSPVNINVIELSDGWSFKYDDKGRVSEQITKRGDEVFLHRYVSYNEDGDLSSIVCVYESLNLEVFDTVFTTTDTMSFNYLKKDHHNNWIYAEIVQRSHLKKGSYRTLVKRQITYDGEKVPPSELSRQIQPWNNKAKNECSPINCVYKINNWFGDHILCELPKDMEMDNAKLKLSLQDYYHYTMPTDTSFFNVAINKVDSKESIFNNLTQEEADLGLTYTLGSQGTILTKFMGYKEKISINGVLGNTYKYAFYATGGYLTTAPPIYTELIQLRKSQYEPIYIVTIAYDSQHEYMYRPVAEHIKSSIKVY